jgi:chorismate synthase
MIRYLTAGESHGKGLSVIVDGFPSNLEIKKNDIDLYLAERQKGFGRGGRQKIENDKAEIISGIRFGKTTGAPISIFIKNYDYDNWKELLSTEDGFAEELNIPRPGHADLAGGIKYGHHDFRNVLERASARETAARVVVGALCKKFLLQFGIDVFGYVVDIGGIDTDVDEGLSIKEIKKKIEIVDNKTGVYLKFPDIKKANLIINKIEKAKKEGDTIGGIVKVITSKLPAGLGDYTQWDKKLDANIAKAIMSIQAFKGIEFGAGFSYSKYFGSEIHDEIFYSKQNGFFRKTNNAGGIEGGMTNGEPIIVKAVVKPISTVLKGLNSVNVRNKKKTKTKYERSDICAVPAASLIAEMALAIEIANAFLNKFGSDDIEFIKENYKNYLKYLKRY